MEIVINIDEELYEMCRDSLGDEDNIEGIIANGTPLPKNHGRLIDADALKQNMFDEADNVDTYNSYEDAEIVASAINIAPTIIEADKKDEGYANEWIGYSR